MSLRSERRFIQKNSINSGMMLEFSYTSLDDVVKNYSILAIDIISKNNKEYLHGLLMDGLADFDLVRLSTQIGKQFNFDPDNRSDPITKLNSVESYELYKSSNIKNDRRYRTFLMSNITKLQQILIGELT